MKYIFDFDDVLFYTTKHRREHMFLVLEQVGIEKSAIEKYYKKARIKGFSLKDMLSHFFQQKELKQKLYEKIMSESKNFINTELIETIKKLGKENCFLITHGGKEFQKDKFERVGIVPLFSEIIILVGSKKKAVEGICEKYKDEKVVFIDDKIEYFSDLDFVKYSNLKTILYSGQDISSL